ncbi:hypothetical protein [Blastopirellula marina]|uniref:DUF4398 domain-containing protein n=1 Tax=Blastopirellula marina TaxID=124 RepID=A0A2S8F2W2_9BACT|nr:hypothetical protein [Blastopirellula marina]PQO26490.1 hypothetical protein C5Y98_30595 [Blastopirellula marina]PTL40803.1 hypothetical protein C5Y97_30610 [Blastopirellula marina]
MNCLPTYRLQRSIAVALALCVVAPVASWAQAPNQFFFPPRTPSASADMIRAQAAMVRAQAQAAVDYQEARKIAAEAYSQELDNALKEVEIYFERRAARDANVLKNHLDEADKRKEKALRRIVDHPELTGEGMSNGKSLNTLKDALRPTVLSYQYLQGDDPKIEQLIAQFDLPLDVKTKIRLRFMNVRGESGVFSAGSGRLNTFDWWPYLLRDEKFKASRDEIQRLLVQVQENASGETAIDNASIEALEQASLALADEFLKAYDPKEMAKSGIDKFRMYRAAEMHLQSMMLAIRRLKNVGKANGALNITRYDPNTDGRNLATLLAYMARNGVEFAPPEPGDEDAYHTLFEMAKNLYVVASSEEDALDPVMTPPGGVPQTP